MTRPPATPRRDERGAVVVIVLVVLTALLSMVAVVIDLAGLRFDRRESRTAADFAVLAAGGAITDALGADVACQQAWAAVRANLKGATPVVTSPGCGAFAGACDASTPGQPAVGVAGPYRVTITYPVPDTHPLMTGTAGSAQPINTAVDGASCERMAVQIRRDRQFTFARIMGIDSGSTTVHSVGRAITQPPAGEVVALLLLERTACNALTVDGNAIVVVDESQPVPPSGDRAPGHIAIDSNGTTCSGSAYILDASGTNSRITAQPSSTSGQPGRLAVFGMAAGATTCTGRACDPSDVAAGRVVPQPLPSLARVGRTPVDHRYNCKAAYTFPAPFTGTVPGCSGPGGAAIDQLTTTYHGPPGTPPVGFQRYPQDFPGGSCNVPSSAPAMVLTGDWYISCTDLAVRNSFWITGNAVFEGSTSNPPAVDVTGNTGHLRVGDGVTPRVVFVRNGSLSKAGQASITLDRVSVILRNGGIGFQGGSGAMVWRGPLSGPLEGLALWSESQTHSHTMSGQANTDVYGVFFAPYAGYTSSAFSLSGLGGQFQMKAQFITYRLGLGGNGTLTMQAPPFITAPVPFARDARLIR